MSIRDFFPWRQPRESVELADLRSSNARLSDALSAKTKRLERIAAEAKLTSNATVKRMARIATGDA